MKWKDSKYETKKYIKSTQSEGPKILIVKQMLQRLPIDLAQG